MIQEDDQLRRANNQLLRKLKQAETIIEFRKKISELLGIPMEIGMPKYSEKLTSQEI